MEALAGLLILVLFVFLIAGLVKPSIIGRFVKSPSRWKVLGIFLVGIVAVSVIGSAGSKDTEDDDNTALAAVETATVYTPEQRDSINKANLAASIAEREDQTMSATALVQAYDNNEVRADENFKNKTFYVEGIVTDVKKDIMDDIYVVLNGPGFRDVQCYFDDPSIAARLDKGMKVTFKGECKGLMMNVLMYNCELVDNLDDLKAS